jgi:COP9 signalosome complex subunit 12
MPHNVCRWIAQGRGHRLKIGECHAALRVCGIMDVEQEEAECFVANLIFKGFMKGYISHEQQLVVLSKSNPFPRLADRQAPFEFLA